MTKTITFSGASDDLIHVSGWGNKYDEVNAYSDGNTHVAAIFEIADETDSIAVFAIYYGSWCFAVAQNNSDDDYRRESPWPISRTFGEDCEYSETLTIEVSDDAEIQMVYPRRIYEDDDEE